MERGFYEIRGGGFHDIVGMRNMPSYGLGGLGAGPLELFLKVAALRLITVGLWQLQCTVQNTLCVYSAVTAPMACCILSPDNCTSGG